MYQFYFLSILLNLLAGIALAFDSLDEKLGLSRFFNREVFAQSGFRVTVGILTLIVGVFKFLSVTAGNVPVVGDLLPAVMGVLLGLSLIVMFYKDRSTVSSPIIETLDAVLIKNRTVLGVLGIIAAIMHFLFPSVLFL
jgi:hypothetical protein